jgi:hypothetical protein
VNSLHEIGVIDTLKKNRIDIKSTLTLFEGTLLADVPTDSDDRSIDILYFDGGRDLPEQFIYILVDLLKRSSFLLILMSLSHDSYNLNNTKS